MPSLDSAAATAAGGRGTAGRSRRRFGGRLFGGCGGGGRCVGGDRGAILGPVGRDRCWRGLCRVGGGGSGVRRPRLPRSAAAAAACRSCSESESYRLLYRAASASRSALRVVTSAVACWALACGGVGVGLGLLGGGLAGRGLGLRLAGRGLGGERLVQGLLGVGGDPVERADLIEEVLGRAGGQQHRHLAEPGAAEAGVGEGVDLALVAGRGRVGLRGALLGGSGRRGGGR